MADSRMLELAPPDLPGIEEPSFLQRIGETMRNKLPQLAIPDLPSLAADIGLPTMPDLGLPTMPELQAALPGMPSLGLPTMPDMPSLDIPSLDALAPPLPVGPVPPPAAAGGITLNASMAEGGDHHHVSGGNPDEIAERLHGVMENEWRALAEQVDSRFRA